MQPASSGEDSPSGGPGPAGSPGHCAGLSAAGQCWVTGGRLSRCEFSVAVVVLSCFHSSVVKYSSFLTILHFRKRLGQLHNAKVWYTL